MHLTEFIAQVPNFDSLGAREKIIIFSWYLQTYKHLEKFGNSQIRECFRLVDEVVPDVSTYLPRMADRKAPDLVRVKGEYKLSGTLKRNLDATYGQTQTTIAVSQILANLPSRIANLTERDFLNEAISCYRVGAYRATIVMTWNLTIDHILHWLLSDASRLAKFNSAVGLRLPKKAGQQFIDLGDFSELKEAEIIEICKTANLISKNVAEILRDKLKRRNMAAHPSALVITQHQADDMITDLVNNVILSLANTHN